MDPVASTPPTIGFQGGKCRVHHKNLVTWENQPERLTGSKPLGDVGFLLFLRVVSGDYGKP